MAKKKVYHVSKVVIGGLTYKIMAVDPSTLGGKKEKNFGILGLCDFEKRTIYFDYRLSKEEICFVIFHELIHASIEATICKDGLKDAQDDSFIHPFSRILWGAMLNSGIVVRWWDEKNHQRHAPTSSKGKNRKGNKKA